jgi:hypothetical protein
MQTTGRAGRASAAALRNRERALPIRWNHAGRMAAAAAVGLGVALGFGFGFNARADNAPGFERAGTVVYAQTDPPDQPDQTGPSYPANPPGSQATTSDQTSTASQLNQAPAPAAAGAEPAAAPADVVSIQAPTQAPRVGVGPSSTQPGRAPMLLLIASGLAGLGFLHTRRRAI